MRAGLLEDAAISYKTARKYDKTLGKDNLKALKEHIAFRERNKSSGDGNGSSGGHQQEIRDFDASPPAYRIGYYSFDAVGEKDAKTVLLDFKNTVPFVEVPLPALIEILPPVLNVPVAF